MLVRNTRRALSCSVASDRMGVDLPSAAVDVEVLGVQKPWKKGSE